MTDERRFYEAPAADGARRSAPAALRNREPIAEVLAEWLPAERAGARDRQRHRRACDLFRRGVSRSRVAAERCASRCAGVDRGVARPQPACPTSARRSPSTPAAADWPIGKADALLSINMVHISPWASALGLIAGAARVLPAGAPLILYGPWLKDDIATAPSNLAFDADLEAPRSGVGTAAGRGLCSGGEPTRS